MLSAKEKFTVLGGKLFQTFATRSLKNFSARVRAAAAVYRRQFACCTDALRGVGGGAGVGTIKPDQDRQAPDRAAARTGRTQRETGRGRRRVAGSGNLPAHSERKCADTIGTVLAGSLISWPLPVLNNNNNNNNSNTRLTALCPGLPR